MVDKIFRISGNKIASFIADEESLKFSSSTTDFTVEGFRDSFGKTLSLSNKTEIKYEKIKSITKEDSENEVKIIYKTMVGLPGECEFSFNDAPDCETFFQYMEKQQYFMRINETLSPFRAVRGYLIGLVIVIPATYFSYTVAVSIANGTESEPSSSKSRIFNYVVGLLGPNGVIGVGIALSAYLLYRIWTRYKQPPSLTKLIPPNS